MADVGAILADLRAEGDELDDLVAGIGEADWRRPTPAEGWRVAHQIAHLAWTDGKTLIAVREPDSFGEELKAALADPTGHVDKGAADGAKAAPADLLARWRRGREEVADALTAVPEGEKLPWYGPPMRPTTMATARLMETWAHGRDVADALGVAREPTARLRHIARFGVRTRDFAFAVNDLDPPGEEFRVELTAPGGADGDVWAFGPEDAAQRVTGSALDFCHVVTQRRHLDDTDLRATGADAEKWLRIAQAFAGPPGTGRTPGQFS